MNAETLLDAFEVVEPVGEPLTDDEVWGEPDPHANDPDGDKEDVEG